MTGKNPFRKRGARWPVLKRMYIASTMLYLEFTSGWGFVQRLMEMFEGRGQVPPCSMNPQMFLMRMTTLPGWYHPSFVQGTWGKSDILSSCSFSKRAIGLTKSKSPWLAAVSCRWLAISCDTVPVPSRARQTALWTRVLSSFLSQLRIRGEGKKTHVWMWELDYKESWALKNWCFWSVVLEKTLERLLDCKEIQSILKEISPGYSFEGLKLKLKLQYFGHLMRRADHLKRHWCWESLRAGGEGEDRGWDGWVASLTQWTWVWVDSGSWWRTGRPSVLRFMGSQRDTTERLNGNEPMVGTPASVWSIQGT